MNFATLLAAMIAIESGGNDLAIGDQSKARGALQIHSGVVRDVNRIAGTRYTHKDAHRREVAIYMATVYLGYYGSKEQLGRSPTSEDLARIWVGGPTGHRKPSTVRYWQKVQSVLPREDFGNPIAAR